MGIIVGQSTKLSNKCHRKVRNALEKITQTEPYPKKRLFKDVLNDILKDE